MEARRSIKDRILSCVPAELICPTKEAGEENHDRGNCKWCAMNSVVKLMRQNIKAEFGEMTDRIDTQLRKIICDMCSYEEPCELREKNIVCEKKYRIAYAVKQFLVGGDGK